MFTTMKNECTTPNIFQACVVCARQPLRHATYTDTPRNPVHNVVFLPVCMIIVATQSGSSVQYLLPSVIAHGSQCWFGPWIRTLCLRRHAVQLCTETPTTLVGQPHPARQEINAAVQDMCVTAGRPKRGLGSRSSLHSLGMFGVRF